MNPIVKKLKTTNKFLSKIPVLPFLPIVKKLKTTNKFLSKIPVLPFLGMVFTLISVLIAIFMAYLALQQVNEIKIEKTHSDVSLGAEVLDEQSALGGIYNSLLLGRAVKI